MKMKIKVCTGKTCKDRFSDYIITRLQNDKERFNLDKVTIEECLCTWKCSEWPNVIVDWNPNNYMNPAKASNLALNNNKKKK